MTIVFVRVLFKDDASVMFALWVFGWPICFMSSLPGISDHALIWLSLAMGMLLDSVFLSGMTYCVLRAIVSRQKRVRITLPPQAPTF